MNLSPEERAADPNTGAEELWELTNIGESAVLAAVAQNPNSPPELLQKLFRHYPREVLSNPIIELILLELPDFFGQLCQKNYYFFARDEKIPDWILKLAIFSSNNSLRQAIATNKNIPICYLEKLAIDPDSNVRQGVAKNRQTPVCALEKLASEEDNDLRCNVARNPNTPVHVLQQFALLDVRKNT